LALETSEKGSANPTRKNHSEEKSVKIPVIIERAQELISEAPRAVSDEISKNLECEWHYNASKDLRFKSYVIKVRQMLSEVQNWLSDNNVLVQGILVSEQIWIRWSVIERLTNKSRHPDVSPGLYRDGICQYRQRRIAKSVPALQNASKHESKQSSKQKRVT